MTITTDVENYPGFAEVIQGPWLMEQMAQAAHCGAELLFDLVSSVDLSVRPFQVRLDGGGTYTADALIVATGAQARWLGLSSERTLFRRRRLGLCHLRRVLLPRQARGHRRRWQHGGRGGALLGADAREGTPIHRRDSLRAEKVMQQRLFAHPKIEVLWDHVIDEVLGTENPKSVTGVRVRHVRSGETQDLPVEGFFVAIGHDPATAIFRGQLEMDAEGYVVTQPGTTLTSVAGCSPPATCRTRSTAKP